MATIREYKGNNIIQSIDDYIVLDFETTGLDPQYESIIEIGALKVVNGVVVDEFNTLVNPCYEISDFIERFTHITNEMLSTAPTIKEVLPQFLDFLGDSIIVAHNANFDINFLYESCMDNFNEPFKNDFIDTLKLSKRLFKQLKSHRLKVLVQEFGLSGRPIHRALHDCQCTYSLYEYCKKYIKDNNIDLVQLSKNHSYNLNANDIIATVTEFDTDHVLYNKTCVFTGTLENFPRKTAMQIVANLGGINANTVNKKTDYLILGNNDYCSSIKDGKSSKQKKAEELILSDYDIQILSENTFYDMIELDNLELQEPTNNNTVTPPAKEETADGDLQPFQKDCIETVYNILESNNLDLEYLRFEVTDRFIHVNCFHTALEFITTPTMFYLLSPIEIDPNIKEIPFHVSSASKSEYKYKQRIHLSKHDLKTDLPYLSNIIIDGYMKEYNYLSGILNLDSDKITKPFNSSVDSYLQDPRYIEYKDLQI